MLEGTRELSGEQKLHAWLRGDTQPVGGHTRHWRASGCAGEWAGGVNAGASRPLGPGQQWKEGS